MPLTVGDKPGPYEILALLGAGGMGVVWKARDTRLDRMVAIKQQNGEHSARSEQEARATCVNYCLSPFGRVQEAVEMLEEMVESDPLNVQVRSTPGNHFRIGGRYDEAIEEPRKTLESKTTRGSPMRHWFGATH